MEKKDSRLSKEEKRLVRDAKKDLRSKKKSFVSIDYDEIKKSRKDRKFVL
jgi:hypothetical protein